MVEDVIAHLSASAVCCCGSPSRVDSPSRILRQIKLSSITGFWFAVFYHGSTAELEWCLHADVNAGAGSGEGHASDVKTMKELGDRYSTEKPLLVPLLHPSFMSYSLFLPSSFLPSKSQQVITHNLWLSSVSLIQFMHMEHPGMLL